MDLKPKMGFLVLAKHGLNSKTWIGAIGLSFFRDQNVEKRREEEKREEEEEKEKKKKREEEKVWILVRFGMDSWISCMEF